MTLLIERVHQRHQEIEEKRRQQEQKRKQDIARRVEERKKAKSAEESKQPEQADESAEERAQGLCDLERLLRYEQRAWSRRKKAIRAFMAINLAHLNQEEPT